MATTTTKPAIEVGHGAAGVEVPSWPQERAASAPRQGALSTETSSENRGLGPSGRDALQALLAFSALHQQVRQRRALASRLKGFETIAPPAEFEGAEQFVLDEVLQLVAERAIAITGADGLGIALAENNEIVLRASAGTIKPDLGQRIQRDSAFSGACFRTAQIIRCDDSETDERVNLYTCRRLGARSMVAVPLCGQRRVIGVLEAFSAEPFGFNDSDVASLELLAELILGALKPEDEDRFAQSAEIAEAELAAPAISTTSVLPLKKVPTEKVVTAKVAAPPVVAPLVAPPEPASRAAVEAKPASKSISAPGSPHLSANLSVQLSANAAPSISATAATLVPQFTLAPESAIDETVTLEAAQESASSVGHYPGIVLVLVLVVVCAVLGGGIWWKLNNAQLGSVLVHPEAKISRPATNPSANATLPPSSPSTSANPSGDSMNGQTNPAVGSGAVLDEDASTEENASATPQDLSKLSHITAIRHWSSADSSTVVLDLEDQVQYEAHRLSGPDRIYFDLHDTALASELAGKTIDIGDALLARVRVAQPVSGLTRIVLETRGNSNYSVSLEPNPYRLVVQVRRLGADTRAQVNLFPGAEAGKEKLAIVVPPPSRDDLQLRARVPKMRIVVDAGHGGWDLGTVGRQGLLEKDLVLEIAQRLGKLLETRLGADVILTRNDDNYIPLDERAGMANQAQADLFVSVHANYSDLPSARGVETYYTNFFSAPNAKDLETRPNTTANKNAVTASLSPAELHDKIEQSRRLAASVQRSLYGTLSAENPGLRDRGVKEASYVVLTETAMPGILAEVSFVSSPTDEQKLRSDGYREEIAEALYKGIARYAAGSRGVKVASAGK
jgi:N-acetylmuramoyl-L-alanine amidase/putative methionine-R-sulfoxide reductase with GAF domain